MLGMQSRMGKKREVEVEEKRAAQGRENFLYIFSQQQLISSLAPSLLFIFLMIIIIIGLYE